MGGAGAGTGSGKLGYRLVKRGLDVMLSGTALLAAGPLIGAAGVAVYLETGLPILYRSRRLGRSGEPFDLLKLRTMHTRQDAAAPEVTAAVDPRITRVGRWLRDRKLDELPQLWNVLVGHISLVGPRPEVERYIKHYPQQYQEVLRVRPGLTDRATLEFIDEEAVLAAADDPEQHYIDVVLPQKIRHYQRYVRQASLREDLEILWQTGLGVLSKIFA